MQWNAGGPAIGLQGAILMAPNLAARRSQSLLMLVRRGFAVLS